MTTATATAHDFDTRTVALGAKIGDFVSFRHYGQEMHGIVVKQTDYPWCIGASTRDVYVPGWGVVALGSCSMITRYGQLGQWAVELCREHYREHLSTFEVWAARFEADPSTSVGF